MIIISPTYDLSRYEKILGVPIHSEELQWILYRHVFAHVLWIRITQIRACCQLWRTLIALLKDEQVIEMLGKMCQIWWQRKFGDSMLPNAITRTKRPRMRCAWFLVKCAIWPETYAKKIWDDLEHFKFARALERARTRTRAFVHSYWPEIDRTDIDLNHVKY